MMNTLDELGIGCSLAYGREFGEIIPISDSVGSDQTRELKFHMYRQSNNNLLKKGGWK